MNFAHLVSENRDRLKRLADLRLCRSLQGRVDSSDIVQEACIDAMKQFDRYQEDPAVTPYLWLRFFLCQKIIQVHRKHIKAQARDARRDVSIDGHVGPGAESSVMAIQLLDAEISPTKIVERRELMDRLVETLDGMTALDREMIALRHFEQLSNQEAAELLKITPDSAYKRYTRALLRLKRLIQGQE